MRCDKHLERRQGLVKIAQDPLITFNTTDSETINDVLSKPKRYFFRGLERFALNPLVICQMTTLIETYFFKQAVKIYVDNIPSIGIQKDIFTMSIAEPCACLVMYHKVSSE